MLLLDGYLYMHSFNLFVLYDLRLTDARTHPRRIDPLLSCDFEPIAPNGPVA